MTRKMTRKNLRKRRGAVYVSRTTGHRPVACFWLDAILGWFLTLRIPLIQPVVLEHNRFHFDHSSKMSGMLLCQNSLLLSYEDDANLSDVGYIEKYGSGIYMMGELSRNWGNREPYYPFHPIETRAIVYSQIFNAVGEKVGEGLVEGLAETQRKIIQLIFVNPKIPKSELAGKIGISTTAIDKNLTRLKGRGLLKRVGPDRGGHWEVITKNEVEKK